MRKSILLLMLALCVGAFSASAERKVLTVKSNYNTISVSCGAKVLYTPEAGKTTTIEISGPANKINWVEVTVSKGTLSIGTKKEENGNRNGYHIKGVTIKVYGPLVNSFSASSSGTLTSTTWFEFNKSNVNLAVSSSGEINFAKVTAPAIRAKASSSGEINISTVHTRNLDMQASSSGDIDIKDVTTSVCDAKASSSGDVDIKALRADQASFQASSSGDVEISQLTADSVDAQASSSGDVALGGKTNRLNASASSGGKVNVKKLSYGSSSVRSSSGGSVQER